MLVHATHVWTYMHTALEQQYASLNEVVFYKLCLFVCTCTGLIACLLLGVVMHYSSEQQMLSPYQFMGCTVFQQRQTQDCTMQDELENAVFGGEQGLMGSLGSDPRDCAVLISGLPGSVTATLTRRLTLEGITRERILFCDFI